MGNQDVIGRIIGILSQYPQVKFERSDKGALIIFGDLAGFDIEIHDGTRDYMLCMGTYHGHYSKTEEETNDMFQEIVFGLSGISRIKEIFKDGKPYTWIVQTQDKDGNWTDNEKVGIISSKSLRKPEIECKYYHNNLIPKEIIFEKIIVNETKIHSKPNHPMINKVFYISGYAAMLASRSKVSSMLIDEYGLKISSREGGVSTEEFYKEWNKTIALAYRVGVDYESIENITKSRDDITISFKGRGGLGHCWIKFYRKPEAETFINYFRNEKKYKEDVTTQSPFAFIGFQLFFIAAIAALTYVGYGRAIDIKNGLVPELHTKKEMFYDYFLFKLGEKGVIISGALLVAYIVYRIIRNFIRPPQSLVLTPPDAL